MADGETQPQDSLTQVMGQKVFLGGENSVADPMNISDTECSKLVNLYPYRGRGLICRGGYRTFQTFYSDAAGRAVFEMDQSTGSVVTYVDGSAAWYDETMQPRYRAFQASPQVNDAIYFGAREPFGQLVFTVSGLNNSDYVFAWEYWNGSAWTAFTTSIVESVSNAKKWAVGASSYTEVSLTWGRLTNWAPRQVETRNYQYWVRSRLVTIGTADGSDVSISQKRVRGDWVGRRIQFGASTARMDHIPGYTCSIQSIEVWPTGTQIQRVRGAQLGDYFYYASDGQRDLMVWNGCRGVTRAGGTNTPAAAGLAPPASAPTLTPTNDTNGYDTSKVLRYRISYSYGPEGIRGEGPVGPSTQVTIDASNKQKVKVDFSAAVTAAATKDVYAIYVYVAYDLASVAVFQRDVYTAYLLLQVVVRDSAAWTAGYITDICNARTVPSQTPKTWSTNLSFRPKYVDVGGNRLWAADDNFVAWSDVPQGDVFDPSNIKYFGGIIGIKFWNNQLLVFQRQDAQYIRFIDPTTPDIGYYWHGLGTTQPDSITPGDGVLFHMTHKGPAALVGSQMMLTQGQGYLSHGPIQTIARFRVWESANYWSEKVSERALCQGAYFKDRLYLPIDDGSNPTHIVGGTAVYTATDNNWTRVTYPFSIGAMAVIHAPLDHPMARDLILVAFPEYDGSNLATQASKLMQLEYGTSDGWTTLQTDGAVIQSQFRSRALEMAHHDRWKVYNYLFSEIRYPVQVSQSASVVYTLLQDKGDVDSAPITALQSGKLLGEVLAKFTEVAAGATGSTTPFRDKQSVLDVSASTDSGFELTSWTLDSDVDETAIIVNP